MWWWMAAVALADEPCTFVGLSDIVAVPAPAVVVLGERFGHAADLGRARAVVKALGRDTKVRVALGSVDDKFQRLLDGAAEGQIAVDSLPELMDWESTWGFDWKAYAPLVTTALGAGQVIAAGVGYGPRPPDQATPLPPRYLEVLRGGMGGFEVPPGSESRLVQAVAWRDYRTAELALQGWDQQGYLVVVVGRDQVEGAKGVAWQLERQTTVPVSAVVLKAGREPRCLPGDRLWK
jgi:hypothetical protein